MLCLFRRDPGSRKWLRAVGLKSPHWRSSLDCSALVFVGLRNVPLGLGMGALSGALRHESLAYGKEYVGVVVRAALADLGSASPGSMLVQSAGELVSGHRSPSRRWNVPKIGCSIFARGSLSPVLGRGGKLDVCSWWVWQGGSGCFGE